MGEVVCGSRLSTGARRAAAAALMCLGLTGVLLLAPSAGARASAVIPVSIVREQSVIVRPSQVSAADGDTIRFCNESNVVASLFSGSKHNVFGGGFKLDAGPGLRVARGGCANVTVHNPTDKPLRVVIGSEIQSYLKLVVTVAPCGAPRTTQAVGKCKKQAAPAPGTFVLASHKITNYAPNEFKVNPGGSATWDHCCDGGKWKIEYTWKVPTTLTAGKSSTIAMSLEVVTVEPRQPLLVQMSALHPDFRQDLATQYPDQPSASKSYQVPLSAGYAGSKQPIQVWISLGNAQIAYTYRPA
jgi:hypothetical protein